MVSLSAFLPAAWHSFGPGPSLYAVSVVNEEKRERAHLMSKYECLLPLRVNTMLFMYVYIPASHIRAPYSHCTQGERVTILFVELLVKMGL